MIYLAADHRGFQLKEELKKFLQEEGYEVDDVGAFKYDKGDDYPDFAYAAALKVAEDPENNRGILLCGSGMGMDVVANKVRGVRATVAYSREAAAHARTNDNINVITLAADVIGLEAAKEYVRIFLNTPFSGAKRHARRLQKIKNIEDKNFR